MSDSDTTFDQIYIITTLIPNINAVTLQTELGGNTNYITRFSFAGGKSTYSFGLYQYDVGNNPSARTFLSTIGFSKSQITQLSSNGGLSNATVQALSAQLASALKNPDNQAAMNQLDATWANTLVAQLQAVINVVGQSNPDIANQIYQNQELQLRLVDYANQFSMSSKGTMCQWLGGKLVSTSGGNLQLTQGQQLTGDDIKQFVMNTAYGVSHKTSESNRLSALDRALATLTLS
jgi:hypothetical protein